MVSYRMKSKTLSRKKQCLLPNMEPTFTVVNYLTNKPKGTALLHHNMAQLSRLLPSCVEGKLRRGRTHPHNLFFPS